MSTQPAPSHVGEVVIACADIVAATNFYQQVLEFDILASGSAVTLGSPEWDGGRLRLIGLPERAGAAGESATLFDLGPRLVGAYSRNLAESVARIQSAGGAAREPVTYPYKGAFLSELVAEGIDDVWLTMPLAQGDAHRPSPRLAARPDLLHSELHSVVYVVEDHARALAFIEALGWYPIFSDEMRGSEFERLLGMPPGASLQLSFLVAPGEMPARIELMSFTGVPQRDLRFSDRGIQEILLHAQDVPRLREAAQRSGAEVLADGSLRHEEGIRIRFASVDAEG